MSRFLTAAARLRFPTDGTPEGGGASAPVTVDLGALPSLRTSPGFIARKEAEAKATKAAPAVKADPATPDKAGEPPALPEDEPGEQISGEGDDAEPEAGEPPAPPEGAETPEQELARLKAEKAALEAGNPDPVKAELEKLRAEIEALKSGKPAATPAEIPAAPAGASRFKSDAEIAAHEARIYSILDFAEEHADGYEGKDDAGKDVAYTPEQIAAWKRQAKAELRALPGEREALRTATAAAAANRAKYPTHFNAAHADAKAVAAIFAENPAIAGNHALAAQILAGRRAAGVPAKVSPAPAPGVAPKAKVAPGSAPASEAPPAAPARREAPKPDRERAMREGRGLGQFLLSSKNAPRR